MSATSQSTSGFKRPKCFKVVRTAPEGATPYEHAYSRRECYAMNAEDALTNVCAETGWRPEECAVIDNSDAWFSL